MLSRVNAWQALRCCTSYGCGSAIATARLMTRCSCLQLPQWCPLSVVKGGQAANLLIRSMDSPWGLKMFGNTLVRNIATVVYQVCPAVCRVCAPQASSGADHAVKHDELMQMLTAACTNMQDRSVLERQIRKNIPPLANTTEFQFGFKIRCAGHDVCIAQG